MRTTVGAITLSIMLLAASFSSPPAVAAGSPFKGATHNIQYTHYGALRYVAERDRPLTLAGQEMCAAQVLSLSYQIAQYGYRGRFVPVTRSGGQGCAGSGQMFNGVYTTAPEICGNDACGKTGSYPSNIQDPSTPNEVRGYACVRGYFGYAWVACSTHLSLNQGYAVFQSAYYKNDVLGTESNLRVKLAAGDFNLRPRSDGQGTFGLDHFYQSYREADNHYYDIGINNGTVNPPTGTNEVKKIDYVFADRFWTLDTFGVQDRRCDNPPQNHSDHCLVIGTFRWAY